MSIRTGRIVGQSVTPSTALRVGHRPPTPRPALTNHDPAAVARLRSRWQNQPPRITSAIPHEEDQIMPAKNNEELLTEEQVRQIHQAAVGGMSIAEAVRQVVGDDAPSVATVYNYFKRYKMGSVKVARDRLAQQSRRPVPSQTVAPAAVPDTAVSNPDSMSLPAVLDRLTAVRTLVRDLEQAGAQVTVSFTLNLQVHYER